MVSKKKKVSKTVAIICLLLNIIIFPGLGSVIGKKTKDGAMQIGIALLGMIILWNWSVWFGLVVFLGAWVWSIVTGVEIIQKAEG